MTNSVTVLGQDRPCAACIATASWHAGLADTSRPPSTNLAGCAMGMTQHQEIVLAVKIKPWDGLDLGFSPTRTNGSTPAWITMAQPVTRLELAVLAAEISSALRRRDRKRKAAYGAVRLGRVAPIENDQLAPQTGLAYLVSRACMPYKGGGEENAGQPSRALGVRLEPYGIPVKLKRGRKPRRHEIMPDQKESVFPHVGPRAFNGSAVTFQYILHRVDVLGIALRADDNLLQLQILAEIESAQAVGVWRSLSCTNKRSSCS
jgi:hypothetical protein